MILSPRRSGAGDASELGGGGRGKARQEGKGRKGVRVEPEGGGRPEAEWGRGAVYVWGRQLRGSTKLAQTHAHRILPYPGEEIGF